MIQGSLADRNGYLDALKGIGIICVTIVHGGGVYLPGLYGTLGRECARGVEMFFVISGFLNFCSVDRYFERPSNVLLKNIWGWYRKKLARFLPLYYFALISAMLTHSHSTYWLGNEGYVSVFNILAHFLFVHVFFPHYINSLLGVEWYIGDLLFFILMTPLLYKFLSSFGRSLVFMLLVYILKPSLLYGLSRLLPVDADPIVYNAYVYSLNPLTRIQVYAMGILLFQIKKDMDGGLKPVPERQRRMISYSLLAFAAMMLAGQVLGKNSLYRVTAYEMYGIWCMMVIVSQSLRPVPLIDNAFFRLFGRYSYGMYLFQFVWIPFYEHHASEFVFMNLGRRIRGDGAFDIPIEIVICVVALLLISIISTKCVEEPVQKALRKLAALRDARLYKELP